MNEYFEINMAAASRHKAELYRALRGFGKDKESMHGLREKNVPEIEDESEKWEALKAAPKEKIAIAVGFGVCLKIMNFSPESIGDSIYFVYEPDVELILDAIEKHDLTGLMEASRINIFAGPEGLASFRNAIFETTCDYIVKNYDRYSASIFRDRIQLYIDQEASAERRAEYEEICNKYFFETMKMVDERMLDHYLNVEAAEIAEYLNMAHEDTKVLIVQSTKLLSEDWNSAQPGSVAEIHEWYKTTPYYIFNLAAYHVISAGYSRMTELVERELDGIKGPILDFGGGDGDMAIRLAERGLNVTYCDVPGNTMKYARWRFRKRGLKVGIIISDSADIIHLKRRYSAILALDVLEHLVNPLNYCRVFHEHLEPGGVLIAKPSFSHDSEEAPMHLAENEKYSDSFAEEMREIGFEKAPPESDVVEFWKKREPVC